MVLKKYSCSLALQKAIYARITSKQPLYKVYDKIPQGDDMPYVRIGEDYAVADDTKTYPGEDITHTVHIFSNYDGFTEVKTMKANIIEAVTDSALDLTGDGFGVLHATVDYDEVQLEEDNRVRHGVVRFRFLVQKK